MTGTAPASCAKRYCPWKIVGGIVDHGARKIRERLRIAEQHAVHVCGRERAVGFVLLADREDREANRDACHQGEHDDPASAADLVDPLPLLQLEVAQHGELPLFLLANMPFVAADADGLGQHVVGELDARLALAARIFTPKQPQRNQAIEVGGRDAGLDERFLLGDDVAKSRSRQQLFFDEPPHAGAKTGFGHRPMVEVSDDACGAAFHEVGSNRGTPLCLPLEIQLAAEDAQKRGLDRSERAMRRLVVIRRGNERHDPLRDLRIHQAFDLHDPERLARIHALQPERVVVHARHARREVAQVGEEILTQTEQQFARPVRKRVVQGQLGIRLEALFHRRGRTRLRKVGELAQEGLGSLPAIDVGPAHREDLLELIEDEEGRDETVALVPEADVPAMEVLPEGAVLVGLRRLDAGRVDGGGQRVPHLLPKGPAVISMPQAHVDGQNAVQPQPWKDAGAQQRRLPEAGDAKQHRHRGAGDDADHFLDDGLAPLEERLVRFAECGESWPGARGVHRRGVARPADPRALFHARITVRLWCSRYSCLTRSTNPGSTVLPRCVCQCSWRNFSGMNW